MGRLLLSLALFAVSAQAQGAPQQPGAARAECSSPGCVALKKVLAERASGFAGIRGKVLFRRPDKNPGEYASKAQLPGASSCTVEVVEKHILYLCLFPPEPYPKLEAQFLRCLEDVKRAIPADWTMWEVPLKAGKPERERLFRAGPSRGIVALEIKLALPKPNLPGVVLMVYQGTFPERH